MVKNLSDNKYEKITDNQTLATLHAAVRNTFGF
jgi:hypothetical protein